MLEFLFRTLMCGLELDNLLNLNLVTLESFMIFSNSLIHDILFSHLSGAMLTMTKTFNYDYRYVSVSIDPTKLSENFQCSAMIYCCH